LAAKNCADVSVKQVKVIPCKTVPQGVSAIFRLNPDGDLDQQAEEMTEAINEVETGEITIATRSVEINGVNVHDGEVIALLDGQLVMSASTIDEAMLGLLEKASTRDRERITLFYGSNITRNEVNRLVDIVRRAYPAHEIELHDGGQPHYQFIIAIE
jgi:dihydroxyacetone kinase-like predicted kinase